MPGKAWGVVRAERGRCSTGRSNGTVLSVSEGRPLGIRTEGSKCGSKTSVPGVSHFLFGTSMEKAHSLVATHQTFLVAPRRKEIRLRRSKSQSGAYGRKVVFEEAGGTPKS